MDCSKFQCLSYLRLDRFQALDRLIACSSIVSGNQRAIAKLSSRNPSMQLQAKLLFKRSARAHSRRQLAVSTALASHFTRRIRSGLALRPHLGTPTESSGVSSVAAKVFTKWCDRIDVLSEPGDPFDRQRDNGRHVKPQSRNIAPLPAVLRLWRRPSALVWPEKVNANSTVSITTQMRRVRENSARLPT